MAEPDPGTQGDPGTKDSPQSGGKDGDDFQPITSREEFDRVAARIRRDASSKFGDYDDLKTKASEFDRLQESQKTELQKATDEKSAAEKRAADAEMRALRLEVASEKGLNTAQAKRLMGTTKEELEADADELLASFKPGDDQGPKPLGGPKPALRGGGDPTDQPDPNMRDVVEKIPRL